MPDIPKQELARWRQVAEKATPGEWHVGEYFPKKIYDEKGSGIGDVDRHFTYSTGQCEGQCEANAAHIATFDPPTVLRLLDRIEEMENTRGVAQCKPEADYHTEYEFLGPNEALSQELARAEGRREGIEAALRGGAK